jgi:hypothetical protein
MSVSSDTNSALLDAVKVEGMKAEMDAVAAIHTAPGCEDFGHPLASRDISASLSPAAADPVPAKRPKLEPDDSLNEVCSTLFVICFAWLQLYYFSLQNETFPYMNFHVIGYIIYLDEIAEFSKLRLWLTLH